MIDSSRPRFIASRSSFMIIRSADRGKVLILSALAVCTLVVITIAQQPEPPGADVSEAVRHDRLPRLGDVTPIQPPVGGPSRRKPLGELPEVPGTTGNPD